MVHVYDKLARHLDDLPGGFPSTESGVEQRILRRLFSEDEAALALHLTLLWEPAKAIARRSGQDLDLVAERLKDMARKGLIYRRYKNGQPQYMALQFAIGIWEYHVNDLDPQLIEDVNEYFPTLFQAVHWKRSPQLRTIPIREDIPVDREVLNHEKAAELVRNRSRIVVAPCICRREHVLTDDGCGRTLEACLIFGNAADFYVENGLGRRIDVKEALEILDIAEREGLVLQPGNARNASNICCCCGCCCQALKAYKRHPQPASIVSTPYVVSIDEAECIACGDCIERCQMEALRLDDGIVSRDVDRCIGCGLCVTTCPTECLTLARKPDSEQIRVPRTLAQTYLRLAQSRGKLKAFEIARMAARSAADRTLAGR